jgi:hypothetical protein
VFSGWQINDGTQLSQGLWLKPTHAGFLLQTGLGDQVSPGAWDDEDPDQTWRAVNMESGVLVRLTSKGSLLKLGFTRKHADEPGRRLRHLTKVWQGIVSLQRTCFQLSCFSVVHFHFMH